MTTESRVLAVLAAAYPTPVTARWVEVRVWAAFDTDADLAAAPGTHAVRDALAELVADGKVTRTPGPLYRVVR